MGWTSYHATNYKKGKVDRVAEVEQQINKEYYEILKSGIFGSTVYTAVKEKKTGEVFAVVTLTWTDSRDYFNFGYKMMDETAQPFYYDCPNSILKLLTPTDNESANKWRSLCRERQEWKKEKKKNPDSLSNLPIGAKIQFEESGKKYTLTKHPASYQFKRPFWMNEKSWKYYPIKYIPDNYEVIG